MKLFISSTWADLQDYVREAERVLNAMGVAYVQFKHWESTGRPSVSVCLERVDACDALIVLVGADYGWVPEIRDGGDGRSSITRLEVQRASDTPKPVLPFFVEDASLPVRHASERDRELWRDFVAEMRKRQGPTVGSIADFSENLGRSVEALRLELAAPTVVPPSVGESTQGRYRTFLDRKKPRARLLNALTNRDLRAAAIVGKGGYGKSALANDAIASLRARGVVDSVIYLMSSRDTEIHEFESQLFTSTMKASGQAPIVYEGSWATLSARPEQLVKVLLDVYRRHRIVVYLDAFEHILDGEGAVRSTMVRSFVEAFLLSDHPSKLLITTRQNLVLSASEVGYLDPVPLDDGLPVAEGVALLKEKLPAGASLSHSRLKMAVRTVNRIPFVVERLALLLHLNPLIDLTGLAAREDTLDEVVARMHSSLSPHARLVLQARAVFEEPMPPEAIAYVLEPELDAASVTHAIAELGRGTFLFPVEGGRIGIHDLDREASYRALQRGHLLDRQIAHRRAAKYYARSCEEREQWFDWTSFEELKSDIQRFTHLVKAGDSAAAVRSINIGKIEFLNWMGYVERVKAMFTGLELPEEDEEARLVRDFALADSLVVTGPFDRAVRELESVIERARAAGQVRLELSAMYEIGGAYRSAGQNDKAVVSKRSMIERVRANGDERWAAYSLYGYSLACSYAGDHVEAIRAGLEQVRYGRSAADSYFVGRGNSSLCLPYFLLGMMRDAEICAKGSAAEFLNTRHEYVVGYIENVHGLALHGLGRIADALEAFEQASIVGRRTWQRRAEALAATNRAWVLYERGDFADAVLSAKCAIDLFDHISPDDAKIVRHLSAAFAWAGDRDHAEEGRELWAFVSASFRNPDLVRRIMVAERILGLGTAVDAGTRRSCEAFIETEQAEIGRTLAALAV